MRKERSDTEFTFDELKESFLDDSWTCKRRFRKKNSCHRWSKWENFQYVKALKIFESELEGTEKERRRTRVFKNMEKMLSIGRTSEQIRGHHKKMIQKYQTVENIIEGLT